MILSGYLGSPEIAAVVADFVPRAKARNPALRYVAIPCSGIATAGLFVHADIPPLVRDLLCPLADIITPNHFEFEWSVRGKGQDDRAVIAQAQALIARGPSTIVVTSAELPTRRMARSRPLRSERAKRLSRDARQTADQPVRDRRPLCLAIRVRRVHGSDTPDALSSGLRQLGHAASAIFAVLERTAARGTEEMRIVESAELLAHPRRRFDAVAIGS